MLNNYTRIIITIITIAFTHTLKAQVGVNTTAPASSLDVVGEPAIAASADGIIAPRITGDQLRTKTAYGADQEGALVYVTAADSAPAGQTINVTAPGYYYFDGTLWELVLVDNLYIADGTLAGNRSVTQNSFDLNFDANTLVIRGSNNSRYRYRYAK